LGLIFWEMKALNDTLDVLTLCSCVLRGCVPKKILMYGSAFSAEFTVSDCLYETFKIRNLKIEFSDEYNMVSASAS